MGQVEEINIKNQSFYVFDNMIDIKDFHSNLLKIDKNSRKDINIYYTGYITIKKFSDYENIHSVNSLYLIIHSTTGYKTFGLELDQKLKQLLVENNCFMKKRLCQNCN